jgi:molybdenum cofactor cytidylyltransferase
MICAVVLAAGLSRRMGTPKLLLPFGGKTVIASIIDQLLQSRVDGIYVVVGGEAERISGALDGRAVNIVRNLDPERGGMLSSVRCGLAALPQPCQGALVVLGDQPAITAGVVDRMVEAFDERGGGILVPCLGGRRGHPILISMRFRDEILAQYDEVGLRGLLKAHPEEILEIEVEDAAVLADMDTPEDYRRELARLEEMDAKRQHRLR